MRLIEILTKYRSIHPFFLGVFFLGAAAICLLGLKDDHVDVKSVIQDGHILSQQSERLLEALSRNDRQVVAQLSEQIKQGHDNRQRLQAEQAAGMRVRQIASIVFAICLSLMALTYFIRGFRAKPNGTNELLTTPGAGP